MNQKKQEQEKQRLSKYTNSPAYRKYYEANEEKSRKKSSAYERATRPKERLKSCSVSLKKLLNI